MCTVSYIPIQDGYLLTSNRDEHPKRETKHPHTLLLDNGVQITAPIDGLKGGTWIAIDTLGRSACLLNGAFKNHIPTGNYRKSRGAIVIEAFTFNDFETFTKTINLSNIEPFTLILVEHNNVIEFVWDGQQKHIKYLPQEPMLWSSSTLYSRAVHKTKTDYFHDTLSTQPKTEEQILEMHGLNKQTPFIIKHDIVKTVSITQLSYDGAHSKITYHPRLEKASVNL